MEPVHKKSWIDDRLAWNLIKQKILYKPLSKDIGWLYTLGSLCLFLLCVQIITGIILACNYVPTIEGAYKSVLFIQNEMYMGWLIRGMHHWGSNMMIIAVLLHMIRVFFHAAYKKPNEITWIAGVFLIILTISMALTGYILPWTDISYWAATIISYCFDYLPIIGSWLSNIVGGKHAGNFVIGRFAAFHMILIPLMTGFFTIIHILLIQLHGEKGPPLKQGKDIETQPFFPHQLVKDVLIAMLGLIALIILVKFAGIPEVKPAAPLAPVDSVPKPEWFLLFGYEMLKMFKGRGITIVLTVIPAIGFLMILLLPFYDRNEDRAYLKRPVAIGTGVAIIAVFFYLTLIACVSTPLPGKFFAPERRLKITELAGMALFEKNKCYSCHSIKGIGMKNAPDLWKVGIKRNTQYLSKLLDNPDEVLGRGKMLKYYIDKYDKHAFISYIKSLDFVNYNERIMEPAVFRSAYLVYGSRSNRDNVDDIIELLKKNRHKLILKGSSNEITIDEINVIAKYLSGLKGNNK